MLNRLLDWLAMRSPAYNQLLRAQQRDRRINTIYASALRDIVMRGRGLAAPNGTAKKLTKVAERAFDTAMAAL